MKCVTLTDFQTFWPVFGLKYLKVTCRAQRETRSIPPSSPTHRAAASCSHLNLRVPQPDAGVNDLTSSKAAILEDRVPRLRLCSEATCARPFEVLLLKRSVEGILWRDVGDCREVGSTSGCCAGASSLATGAASLFV